MGANPSSSGRAYAGALVLLAAGAVVVLVAYGLTWAVAHVPLISGADDTARALGLSGRELLPWAAASGWVALAGVAGILATRSWGRQLVGVLVALAGLVACAGAVWFALSSDPIISGALGGQVDPAATVASEVASAWLLAVLGGLAVTAAGVATVVLGRGWPTMGSKYERTGRAPSTRSAWELQDLGQDPTDDLVE